MLAGTALLARRINVAPAILLLLAGIALAFVPGMPVVELPPELVLLLVLPPLIYSASVAMSWREFKSNLRPIILLSVGCVIFTAFAVAAATHYLIGLPWSVGFLLGAIVAPPDVVAPLAIARKLGLPRRILVVLEGEGLANDATALILYRFAVAAISTGLFSLPKATGTFAVIVVGEVLFGVAIGWLSLHARHRTRDPQVEITLSLITPYLAFWIPEHLGGSGVIATVACGLYMSWNGPLLISVGDAPAGHLLLGPRDLSDRGPAVPADRIPDAAAVREIEGVSAPGNPARDRAGRRHRHRRALCLGLSRDLSAAPHQQAPARTRSDAVLARRVRGRLHRRAWRGVAGRRTGAAVRAAGRRRLSLSRPDPVRRLRRHLHHAGRTWVGLPPVVRWLGVAKDGRDEHIAEHESEIAARREALDAALKSLDAITDDRELSDEVVKLLRARHEIRTNQLPDSLDPDAHDVSATGTALTRELIAAERKFIHALLRDGKITDETRRRIERDLDLEEASLSNREYRKIPL